MVVTDAKQDNSDSSQQLLEAPPTIDAKSQLRIVERRKATLPFSGLATTCLVVVLVAGIATTLLGWILIRRFSASQSFADDVLATLPTASFIVNEGQKNENYGGTETTASMRALTFSSLSNQIIGWTNALVMGLVAYRTAGQWIQDSEDYEVLQPLGPTPVQYGILVSLLGGPSYPSLVRACKYAWQRKGRSSLTQLFVEPLAFSIALFALSHGIGAGDLWLHSTAQSILVPIRQPFSNSSAASGFAFDQVVCDTYPGPAPGQPCLHGYTGWANHDTVTNMFKLAGMGVAYNSSETPVSVTSLADAGSMAILVSSTTSSGGPQVSAAGSAFTFSTIGAKANCTYLNPSCAVTSSQPLSGTVVTSCTSAGWPWLPVNTTIDDSTTSPYIPSGSASSDTRIFSIRNESIGLLTSTYGESGQQFPNYLYSSNPTQIGIQLEMPLAGMVNVLNWTSVALMDAKGFTYAGCGLEYFNVTASYDPLSTSPYAIVNSTSSTPYFTSVLLEPLISQLANQRLAANLQYATLSGNITSFEALLEQELARMAIAWPAALFQAVPPLEAFDVSVVALGAYPMAPVIFLVALLYAYALLTVAIFLSSRKFSAYAVAHGEGGEKVDAVDLGQKWLTNPLPLVAMVFSEADAGRSVAKRSVEMFDDTLGERLVLGVHSNDGTGVEVSGIRKRGPGTRMKDSF